MVKVLLSLFFALRPFARSTSIASDRPARLRPWPAPPPARVLSSVSGQLLSAQHHSPASSDTRRDSTLISPRSTSTANMAKRESSPPVPPNLPALCSPHPSSIAVWGGRFTGATDPLMHAFNQSLSYDKRMYKADIVGSQAYAKGLVKAGVLNEQERQVGGSKPSSSTPSSQLVARSPLSRPSHPL